MDQWPQTRQLPRLDRYVQARLWNLQRRTRALQPRVFAKEPIDGVDSVVTGTNVPSDDPAKLLPKRGIVGMNLHNDG